MKKALIAVVLILALGGCGGGGGDDDGPDGSARTDEAPSTDGDAPATTPRGVETARRGQVNVPAEGSYRYEYTSELVNNTTPDATPQRADDDAELRRVISVSRDVVSSADRTTEGPAVATVKRRYDDDGIYELSFETKAPRGTSSCTYEEPVQILPIPLEEAEFEDQSLEGEGSSCNGERTVTVEGPVNVQDADGTTWRTWKIVMETTVRSETGLSSRNSLSAWFSPDLGTDVKIESVAETIDPQGEVAARGESTQLLTSYPT